MLIFKFLNDAIRIIAAIKDKDNYYIWVRVNSQSVWLLINSDCTENFINSEFAIKYTIWVQRKKDLFRLQDFNRILIKHN